MSERAYNLSDTKQDLDIEKLYKKKSQYREIWMRMRKNKAAMVGLIIISVFVFVAIFADLIVDYESMAISHNVSERLQWPSLKHWFGTDTYGRDVFARIIHGARISLSIGVVSTAVSIFFGGLLGAIAGYYGNLVESLIMRLLDIIMCIPAILLALAIVAALGPGMRNLLIAITVANVPPFTRLIRSVILTVVEKEFVEAARAIGTKDSRIIVRHILPNAMGPIIVQATMSVAGMIITAAALSFIGMGIQPPTPEWGAMLAGSRNYMRHAPYLVMFPGFTIVLAVLSLNLVGDGLRDAIDPRLKN